MKCARIIWLVASACCLLGMQAWGQSPADSALRRIEAIKLPVPAIEEAIDVVRFRFPADSVVHRRIEQHFVARYTRSRDSLWLAGAWVVGGQSRMLLSDLKGAAEHYERAWFTLSRRNVRELSAHTALQLASIEQFRQQGAAALRWIERCLTAAQPHQVLVRSGAWAIQGNIHHQLQQYSEAAQAFHKALWLLQDVQHAVAKINFYSNLGAVYGMALQTDSSIFYIEKAYQLNAAQPVHLQSIEPIVNLSSVYLYDKVDLNRAQQLLTEALKLCEQNPVLMGNRFLVLMNQGEVWMHQHQFKKALQAYWKAWHAAQTSDRWDALTHIAPRLISTHARAGSPPDSIERYVELLKVAQDTVANRTRSREVRELQARFEVAEKDRLIALQEAEADWYRLLIVALIVGTLLKIVVLVLVIRSRRRQKRANEALMEQKRIIEQQKEELEQQAEELRERNSDLTAANHELAAANDRLQELDRFKNAVTGMIVHDLKNPLNAILLLARMLPPSEQAEAIRQAGQQMLNLTLNLLDVQKYEAGSLPIERRELPLAQLVDDAQGQVALLCKQKHLRLLVDAPDQLVVSLDSGLIVRLLVNLLTNAIKFSPNGNEIQIGAAAGPARTLRLWVCDQGPGVPPDQREAIFTPFVQAEARDSGVARSTGLGLAFCRAAAHAHGGHIWVEDGPNGVGSCFIVELPEAVVAVAELSSAEEPSDQAPQMRR